MPTRALFTWLLTIASWKFVWSAGQDLLHLMIVVSTIFQKATGLKRYAITVIRTKKRKHKIDNIFRIIIWKEYLARFTKLFSRILNINLVLRSYNGSLIVWKNFKEIKFIFSASSENSHSKGLSDCWNTIQYFTMAQYRFLITSNNNHHHDQQNKYNLFRILQYILNRVYKICCKDIFLYVQYDAENQPSKRNG